ncbi:litaf-like zinc finger domain-containing protein [Stagonosporopsis vannaccii]|nr:litaf-like zinc finger domain-containing protein [Stagonosporopsis vannaccii]
MSYQPVSPDQVSLIMNGEPALPPYPTENYKMSIPASNTPKHPNIIPLSTLTRSPAPVECPACKHRGITSTDYESGNTTRAWALGLLLLTWCLCCIPYCMTSTKNVSHKCGQCGVLLATWHRSGHTEVQLYDV